MAGVGASLQSRQAQTTSPSTANANRAFGKATLIDFNYDIQPVPGKFPLPGIGPLSLLKQTRLNHLGKLAFRVMYWSLLLPGRHIPLVSSRMSTAGKHLDVLDRYA